MKHIYFFITLMTFLTTCASAQVTLVAPTKMVKSGDSIVVELLAKSRDTLSTLQFSLSWNPSILSFGRVDTLGGLPPSAVSEEFGLSNISQGKLTYLWISSSTTGFRVADSIGIFKVVFKAIGANNSNSLIQFVPTPTQIKASNAQLLGVAVSTQDGNVKIGTTATSEENNAIKPLAKLQLEQNKPNPFHNQTLIPFYLNETGEVFLSLYDFRGQKVLGKKELCSAGHHEWLLNTEGVLANGFYVYSIRTSNEIKSKVLIKN